MINIKEKHTIITKVKDLLENGERIKYSYLRNWNKNFPNEPGVYAFHQKGRLCYIGETADLRSRMSDSRRTYNHSFRKKVGKLIFNSELVKNKYPDDIETKMNQYFEDHITVSFVAIDFGRLEIETALIDSYPESQLLNSIGKRGKK